MQPSQADPSSRVSLALKAVRALFFPIDGVLNGSRITVEGNGLELCSISIRDALGIKEAVGQGIRVAVYSPRSSEGYRTLLGELGVRDFYFSSDDFFSAYESFRDRYALSDEACACIGDDIGDIPVLEKVGFPVTAINGADYLRNRVGYISAYEGGDGCIREIVEMILSEQGKWPFCEASSAEG
ncbi:MAG TPA: 3-deoxy-D-manno-octulosonate 8-phosphate phosphatase [Chlorobium sp.]|uniref:3-deoxy-D-manno-octulosonate 8-phosphate phosphatase, YrbI family n=1 Tax=Chlorobium phaeovibrioides (strain DSM 265 / 1930) TaxID=290318 RepID=A4SGU5_CHLPM|nr:3-deoxy-D-manno-octulosonate 8-phosphate phosphatase [Chlorobium sp.]